MRARLAVCVAVCVVACSHCVLAFERFKFWEDYPGSAAYKARNPKWWDSLQVRNGTSFISGDVELQVDWDDHGAIHLYADPSYLQHYDDLIRTRNGPLSKDYTGTLDSCGWPAKTPQEALNDGTPQWKRSSEVFHEDFSGGLDPSRLLVATDVKNCCLNISQNVNIGVDNVNGVVKNVLELTAWNTDIKYPNRPVTKIIKSAGMVYTTQHFASASYEIQARVPQASGVVWAMWTFHYEEHLPSNCADYSCYCGDGSKAGCPLGECMPPSAYKANDCPMHGPLYSEPCSNATLCNPYWASDVNGKCGMLHKAEGSDPQFVGSSSFTGVVTQVNHEIDIEIPANCEKSTVCDPSCAGDYSTANFNNYIYTNNGGEGKAYANMCVKAAKGGKPMNLIDDDEYHTYRFDWHTGTPGNDTSAYVDFFIDDVYMGTNNAFVPSRGSRLALSLWGAHWNGEPLYWGGGHPGDGYEYAQTARVSAIRITPFNEGNDLMYMAVDDQPEGCEKPIITNDPTHCHTWTEVSIAPQMYTMDDDPFDDDPSDDPSTDDDAPPPATDDDGTDDDAACNVNVNKPLGCPCTHSWECTSNTCAGIPSTCQK